MKMSRSPERRPELVLYVRQGCHLCDVFLTEMQVELGPVSDELRIVDVDSDVELATRYGLRVPVLTVGGILVCEGVYDAPQVRDELRL